MLGETARDERDGALGGIGAGALRCISNLGSGSSCAGSVGPLRFPHRNLPSREPCESPRRMNHAWACGCGGGQPPFESRKIEGRAESTMVPTAMAQKETLNEERHRKTARRDG